MTTLNIHPGVPAPVAIAAQVGSFKQAPMLENHESFWLQLPLGLRELIDCAAECASKTRTDFVRDAMLEAAEGAILTRAMHLTENEMAAVEDILDSPLSENAAYQRMMSRKAPWER